MVISDAIQQVWSCGLVWFLCFNGISTFVDYLMPKPSFKKNNSDAIYPITGRIGGVHTFPKGICPKVNVIAWLEFELA